MTELSRRDVLKILGLGAASTLLATCAPELGTPSPETNSIKEHPTFGVDPNRLYPENNLFGGEIFGRIVSLKESNPTELEKYENAIKNTPEFNSLTGKISYDGYDFEDQTGKKRTIIVVFTDDLSNKKQSGMYIYTPFDEEVQRFVPVNETPANSKGRLFPIISVTNEVSKISTFGLGKEEEDGKYLMTVELFRVIDEKNVIAYDFYSARSYNLPTIEDAPGGAKKILASLVPVDKLEPEVEKFNKVESIEDLKISTITISQINSGELARDEIKYIEEQKFLKTLQGRLKPEEIGYYNWLVKSTGIHVLNCSDPRTEKLTDIINPTKFISLYKLETESLKIETDTEVYVASYAFIDTSGKILPVHFLFTKKQSDTYPKDIFENTTHYLKPATKQPSNLRDLFYLNGKVNDLGDIRVINETLYKLQGLKEEDVVNAFDKISETSTFEGSVDILSRTLYHASLQL